MLLVGAARSWKGWEVRESQEKLEPLCGKEKDHKCRRETWLDMQQRGICISSRSEI